MVLECIQTHPPGNQPQTGPVCLLGSKGSDRKRKRKGSTYKGVPKRLSADFSKETLQARRCWKEVFKVMKDKGLQPRFLYPSKLSFRMEGQIKCFPDKVKLKEFIITKLLLHEMLKGLI